MHERYPYFTIVRKMHENHESQKKLAAIIGIGDLSLRNKLAGRVEWSIGEIEKLCEHYNMDFYELFKRD